MAFAGVNYLAILIAAVAGFAFGAAYYVTLSRPWHAAIGKTKEELAAQGKRSPAPFVISIIALAVMAWTLAGIMGHLGAVRVAGFRHHHPCGQQCFRPAQADAHGYRWHSLAGRAGYTGRHHRRDRCLS